MVSSHTCFRASIKILKHSRKFVHWQSEYSLNTCAIYAIVTQSNRTVVQILSLDRRKKPRASDGNFHTASVNNVFELYINSCTALITRARMKTQAQVAWLTVNLWLLASLCELGCTQCFVTAKTLVSRHFAYDISDFFYISKRKFTGHSLLSFISQLHWCEQHCRTQIASASDIFKRTDLSF